MKRIFNNFLNISVILTIFLSVCVSCSKDGLEEDDRSNNHGNNINVEDIRLCSEWGLTQEEVIEYMEGYTLDKEEGDYLYFSKNNASLIVSYEFDGGELRSSLLMVIENKNIESKILDIVSEYTKVGSVDDVKIYFSESENAVASYGVEVDDNRTYLTLGITKLHIDSIPNNQIWYTNGSTTTPTTPYKEDVFGANIISNKYDAEIGQWVITFDGDVTSIGDYAFKYRGLTSITIPDSVTSIGKDAFYDCSSLISITIPDSVTSIEYSAFYDCSSLTSITIPDSVTSIESFAFFHCSSLESITIPDSVTEIEGAAFAGCSSLTSFYGKFASDDNRCLVIDGKLISFAPAGLTSYTIPNSVSSIGGYSFSKCNSLTSVTIPNSVTAIWYNAFSDCNSLTSITIPNSVTEIREKAFYKCCSLSSFYGKFASDDNRCLIIDGKLIYFAPAGITSYTIPNSVSSIGEEAFAFCSNLSSITIPDSVTDIGESAFMYCSNLKSVIIPESITSIKFMTFFACASLTSVTIPSGVTEIGFGAFNLCDSLTNVYCKPTTPPTCINSAFNNNASGRKIYVPATSVNAYKAADGWKDYADAIVGYKF